MSAADARDGLGGDGSGAPGGGGAGFGERDSARVDGGGGTAPVGKLGRAGGAQLGEKAGAGGQSETVGGEGGEGGAAGGGGSETAGRGGRGGRGGVRGGGGPAEGAGCCAGAMDGSRLCRCLACGGKRSVDSPQGSPAEDSELRIRKVGDRAHTLWEQRVRGGGELGCLGNESGREQRQILEDTKIVKGVPHCR